MVGKEKMPNLDLLNFDKRKQLPHKERKEKEVKGRNGSKRRKRYKVTEGTEKIGFYIKLDLYRRLRNFAYWDRLSLTEAFNIAMTEGLKGKNTKDKE